MPYVVGESLRARLQRELQLPIEDALRLTREIAAALGHAHQQDLVHRDVKPENILIVDGMALVADFGIARTTTPRSPDEGTQMATMAGVVIGTPRYMSPEQATGGAVDQRSDLYSLACVLFEMLAGHPPFVAGTADALLRMHVTAEASPVSESRPAVPSSLARVVARGLAKRPEDRFASTAQFAEAIAAAMTDVSTAAAPPAPAGTTHHLPRPRTQFIGREREIADCVRLLDDTRLLTLTGIGGGGKTRLAIRIAEETRVESSRTGSGSSTWRRSPTRLESLETIAGALRRAREPGQGLEELARAIASAAAGCCWSSTTASTCSPRSPPSSTTSSRRAGDLRLLATSREGLGVDGERLFAVRSLPAPPPDARDMHVGRGIRRRAALHGSGATDYAGLRARPTRTRPWSRISAGGSTAFRWRSSWPPRA